MNGAPESSYWGMPGEYVEMMQPTTEAPIEFHLAAALTLTGLLAGRWSVPMGAVQLWPTLYAVCVGSPGTKKTTAISAGVRQLDPVATSAAVGTW